MSYGWGRKEYKDLGFTDECATVLEVDRVQEIIQRRAERYKIRVVWCADAHTAVTRNETDESVYDFTITLPAITSPCSHEDLLRTYMYVVHECGHLLRPKVWDIAIAAQPGPELMSIFNIVEDDGMERDMAGRHLGDAKTLGEGNAVMAKDGEIYWRQAVADATCEITEESLMPMIVMAIQMLSRRTWDGWSRDAVQDWLKVMPVEGQPLMTELVKEGWVDKFRDTKHEYDSWNLACDLYDRLYPPTDEVEQQEREETREAGNTGEPRQPTNGEDGEQRHGEDDAPHGTEDEGGKVEGDTEVLDNANLQGYVINWKDVVSSEHDKEGYANGGNYGVTYEGRKVENGVAFMPDKDNNVIDLTPPGTNLDDFDTRAYRRKGRPAKKFMHKDHSAAVLANKIRRYVQSQSRVKFRSEREHGRINGQDITRLLLPPVDGGNWNKKVFYDQTQKRALNTAVHILVDWSGSMSGDKQVFAAAAATRAANVFGRCLRMPVMVSSFTVHNYGGNDIAIMKHFDKPQSDKAMAHNFAQWCAWSGGNDDADSVMWAHRRLLERKEQRKLLIVMSDGAPAEAYKGHAHDALLAATRHIQDNSPIELFGLGIRSDAVSTYYDNYEVVRELECINQALLDVIKKSVTYG